MSISSVADSLSAGENTSVSSNITVHRHHGLLTKESFSKFHVPVLIKVPSKGKYCCICRRRKLEYTVRHIQSEESSWRRSFDEFLANKLMEDEESLRREVDEDLKTKGLNRVSGIQKRGIRWIF